MIRTLCARRLTLPVLFVSATALLLAGCSKPAEDSTAKALPPPGQPGSPVGKMNPNIQRSQQDLATMRTQRRPRPGH